MKKCISHDNTKADLTVYLADRILEHCIDTQKLIFSPDTDVLVLVIAHYDQLISNTSICLASGTVQVQPIWKALGAEKAKALPAFHAFSGADNTGRLSRIGKTTWFHVYQRATSDVVKSLTMLSDATDVSEDQMLELGKLVCAAYAPKGVTINRIPELRWYLFCKHKVKSCPLRMAP